MGELVDQMLAYWRNLMVIRCAGEQASDLSVPSRCRPDLIRQAKALTLDAVLAGLDVLSTTRLRLHDSSHGRTLVEMALVRLCRLSDLLPVAQLAQMVAGATTPRGASESAGRNPSLAPRASVRAAGGSKKKPQNHAADASSPNSPSGDFVASRGMAADSTVSRADDGHFLEKAGLPAITGPNSLVLHFPADYNQARDYCQEPARLAKIEEAVRKGTGHPWILRVEAGGDAGAPVCGRRGDAGAAATQSSRRGGERTAGQAGRGRSGGADRSR